MPLSPQDQAYWKRKLGWRSFLQLATITAIVGCIIWPLTLFTLSWSSGRAGDWTWSAAFDQSGANFFLALLVSTLIWCMGQAFNYLGWLPPRK